MKNIILILFALAMIAKAQDLEPTQQQFLYHDTLRYLSPDSYPFNQTTSLLGWHWGGGRSMTEALKMNQVHSRTCYWSNNKWNAKDTSEFADNLNMIVLTHETWSAGLGITPLQSLSMQYEPTLLITNPGSFTVREDDPANSIFGFKYIRGRILSNPTDNNYNRLILTTDSLPNWQDSIVLRNAWLNNQFYNIGYNPEINQHEIYNTYDMYLAINLRRFTETLSNTDTILSIRLPYSTYPRYMVIRNQNGDSIGVKTDSVRKGYIKFKEVPDGENPIMNELANDRGKYLSNVELPNLDYEQTVFITSNMLPLLNDPGRPDITLFAKFYCDSILGSENIPYLNYKFKKVDRKKDDSNWEIDTLDVEVKYHGSQDIAINYIRICTENAKNYFNGSFDENIIDNVQFDLDTLSKPSFIAKGIKPFRFYTIDEEGDAQIWGAYRYFNKLIGNLGLTEMNPIFPKHFNYYVNPPNFIPSIGLPADGLIVPPYNPKGQIQSPANVRAHTVMGYKWGYKLYGNADTLKSDW